MKHLKPATSVIAFTLFMANAALAESCAQLGYIAVADASIKLNNQYIFAQDGPGTGGVVTSTWNEDHCPISGSSEGDLIEHARGLDHPIDPTKKVGSWTTNPAGDDAGVVSYTYFGDATYNWKLYSGGRGGTNRLCWEDNGTAVATGTIKSAAQYCNSPL